MGMLWRGSHKFRGNVSFQGGVNGVFPERGNGKTFYVDSRSWGSGDDDNLPGTDPNHPLAKIQTAIDLCTTKVNDYIVVLDGYDNDASTILVNKQAIHIIGAGVPNPRAPWVWLRIGGSGTADVPVFTLVQQDGQDSEIAGFALAAGTGSPCITTSVGTGVMLSYCWLHHLSFADSTDADFLAQDGIKPIDGAVMMAALIEDCVFGDQLTRDGIRFKSMTKALIRNCYFNQVAGIGVDSITGGAADGMPDVIDCLFHGVRSQSEGWAITSVASGDGFICGNRASSTFDTNGANPYLDHADLNEWCMNYDWDEVMAPATT